MLTVAMLLCLLLASNAGASGCDCSKFPNLPAEIQGWCNEVAINGTLVDYQYFEENETALLICEQWVPYNQTVDAYFPAIKTETTPHAVTTTDKYNFSVELVDVTEQTYPSEECAVLTPGGECQKVIPAQPETGVAFTPEAYQSPDEVESSTNCYEEQKQTGIEVQQPVTGHAQKLVRSYYRVVFNHSQTVEDKVGATVVDVDVQGNPCPNNCDARTGPCTPCAVA